MAKSQSSAVHAAQRRSMADRTQLQVEIGAAKETMEIVNNVGLNRAIEEVEVVDDYSSVTAARVTQRVLQYPLVVLEVALDSVELHLSERGRPSCALRLVGRDASCRWSLLGPETRPKLRLLFGLFCDVRLICKIEQFSQLSRLRLQIRWRPPQESF